MFAIIEDGSRQYRVQPGDKLKIDFRDSAQPGESLRFDRVLAAGTDSDAKIGRPVLDGAAVEARVLETEVRGPKLEIGKFRRRKGHIRHNGHIQKYTSIEVTAIHVPGLAE
jgi:large subunit ribosomal protein L21